MKGPSEKGDHFAVLEYMKAGQVVTHPCAPLQKIEFFIQSPSPSPEPTSPPPPPPVLIWKGEPQGKIKKEVTGLNRKMRRMVQTVTKKGKTNEAAVLFIVKETLRDAIPLQEGEQCAYTADGAPAHMHASVALAFGNAKLWLYITTPNCTPYIQACDKKMVNGAFKSSLEESYAEWVEDRLMGEKRKRAPVPVPSREETATWVLAHLMQSPRIILRPHAVRPTSPKG